MRLIPLLAITALALGQDEEQYSGWKVLTYEAFEVEPLDSDGDAEALIDGLLELAQARSGLTNVSGGGIYFTLTADPFGQLVRMGPAALPTVLKHLNDGRKTKLDFPVPQTVMGGMLPCRELLVPPGRSAEVKRIRDAFGDGVATDWFGGDDGLDLEKDLKGHTATVGDCCFAILGQIVNRPYQAVRYQRSLITAVCSPTLDPRIAKAMRAVWGRGGPRQVVARSLQDDFHTRGPDSSWLQAGAAARLCLYFPEQGGPLVVHRINGLSFDEDKDGIEAAGLLWQVLKTDHPAVRKAWMRFIDPARPTNVLLAALGAISRKPDKEAEEHIRRVFEETDDTGVMLACLDWIPLTGKGLFQRLERTLHSAEARGADGYGDCQGLIDVMIRVDGRRALGVCRSHMTRGHARKLTVLGSLYWAQDPELADALTTPLLADTAPLGPMGGIPMPAAFSNTDRRVCDYAAVVLARSIEGLEFTNPRRVDERDREIAMMRKALAKR